VSLDVRPGVIVSILGPSGAGKSTAFKTIVGFLTLARDGWCSGMPIYTGLSPDFVLRRGLAYVPQGRIVFPQMTVLENRPTEGGHHVGR
jgi:branched-chain amino acid transport system ATP-binding protein